MMKIAYTTVIACLCASHASSAPASGSLARLLAGEQPEAAAAAAEAAAAPAKTVSSAPKASLASALRGVADAEEDRALTSSSAGTTSANSSGTQATSNSLVATNVSADDLEMAKARRNANVSVLPGNKDIKQREKAYKVSFDGILMYLPVTDLKWSYVASKIDAYGKVQLVIEFIDQGANLKKIASGAYDSKLRAFGKDAAKDGRQIYVRMLHEMNGDWYNWCAFFGDNTVGDFKNAYKHAVTVLRSTGANIKFQMSYAANNASKKKTPFKDFYVGDEYVDQVCTSAYNQCGATYPKNKSLEDVFGDFYTEVQTFTKRPICIAEMSSTGICKGKPAWISATWKSLATKFTRVSTINWFFENKKNLGRDWDLNTKADIHAFTSGYRLFRKVTGRRLEAIESGASAEEADALALVEAEAHAAAEEDALEPLA